MVYHIRARRAAGGSARAMTENGAKRCTPISATVRVCDMCGISCIQPGGLMRHGCGKHDERAVKGTTAFFRLRCGESPHHIMVCCGWRRPKAKHGVQAGVSEGPGLRLAGFLLERMRHAPEPHPLLPARQTPPALGQDPGRDPPGSRRAVHPSRSGADDGALVRRDEAGQAEAVRRMAPTRRRSGLSSTTRTRPWCDRGWWSVAACAY